MSGLPRAIYPFKNNKFPYHFDFKDKAFSTTLIELKAISKAAKGGDNNKPEEGKRNPAAIGKAIKLYPMKLITIKM